MTPDEVTTAVQQLASDDGAGENANLDAETSTCPKVKLEIGIFFDGTFNDALDPSRAHTNVFRLQKVYKGAPDTEYSDCGAPGTRFLNLYVQGVGPGGDRFASRPQAGATGFGPAGILARMAYATEQLRGFVDQNGGFAAIDNLTVDIFGFSRGATTARIYANALAAAGIEKLRIRFMGIFDTVASLGLPGNSDERFAADEVQDALCRLTFVIMPTCVLVPDSGPTFDLNIRASSAETVFHITAQDEYRAFFPLSRALPGHATEVSCPGCHGDIGGSTAHDAPTEEYSFMSPPGPLRTNGWFDNASRSEEWRGNSATYHWRRPVAPGLAFAPLQAMHTQALAAGVPFLPLTHARMREDVSVPDDLRTLASLLSAGVQPSEAICRPARAAFAHRAWDGMLDNRVELDFTRDIYPNRP
ncbi:DUF2235 domain-containing protein [Oceanicola sp. D3]|uniref:T6SS phospholipase effector Tle1-like catalytic domain-containing protein n=1 Tax=Oceanicola sp. D3 TaxID=2587163 RepID=UPI00111FB781|nr:DUF2235 domain-containing protein [Oceanicola sp. D3]QDC09297.1 DUF2235 domain-containing protein [Oceanicola sp. D3]